MARPAPWFWKTAAVAAIVLAAAAWLLLRQPGPLYETTPVARGDIQATVAAIGTLQPRRYVDVGAQVSGQIQRLHAQPGDVVRPGQLLVEIDPSVQQAVVDAGRAAIASLRAQRAEQQARHRLAVQQAERQARMAAEGSTRAEDVQTAQAELAVALARIASLDAQIEQTRASQRAEEARLGYTRIYAPMGGTVVAVEAREGQTLNATYQTPRILRIADLAAMTAWTEVSEADVRRLRPGMPVSFTTLDGGTNDGTNGDAPPRRWHSAVRQILPAPPLPEGGLQERATPAAAVKAVTYTVLFDVDNADGALMPQMTAQALFVTAEARQALVVPLAALQGDPGSLRARVLAPQGRVQERAVRTGVRSRHQAEVLDGLAEGETLIVSEQARGDRLPWIQW